VSLLKVQKDAKTSLQTVSIAMQLGQSTEMHHLAKQQHQLTQARTHANTLASSDALAEPAFWCWTLTFLLTSQVVVADKQAPLRLVPAA